jgi:hypothetical protein
MERSKKKQEKIMPENKLNTFWGLDRNFYPSFILRYYFLHFFNPENPIFTMDKDSSVSHGKKFELEKIKKITNR